MTEESISQEFILKNIDETRNYFIEKINQNKLMSKKCKKVCMDLKYIEHLLILASAATGCVSISAFATVVGILIGSLNTMKGLISKALIDSYISHDEFVLATDMLKGYGDIKEKK